jgi:hypothetical protein
MSKIKEDLLYKQEVDMEYYNWFMEFVYENLVSKDISEFDINNMERSFNKPLTAKDVIVSKELLNNKDAA